MNVCLALSSPKYQVLEEISKEGRFKLKPVAQNKNLRLGATLKPIFDKSAELPSVQVDNTVLPEKI
jgi:hypothetical protein